MSEWNILYTCIIEGAQIIIQKNIVFLSMKIDFVFANGDGPDITSISSGPSLFANVPVLGFFSLNFVKTYFRIYSIIVFFVLLCMTLCPF